MIGSGHHKGVNCAGYAAKLCGSSSAKAIRLVEGLFLTQGVILTTATGAARPFSEVDGACRASCECRVSVIQVVGNNSLFFSHCVVTA